MSCPRFIASCSCCARSKGSTTADAATALSVSEDVVKTRLHRAKELLQRTLAARIGGAAGDAFPFHDKRCDRIVTARAQSAQRLSSWRKPWRMLRPARALAVHAPRPAGRAFRARRRANPSNCRNWTQALVLVHAGANRASPTGIPLVDCADPKRRLSLRRRMLRRDITLPVRRFGRLLSAGLEPQPR